MTLGGVRAGFEKLLTGIVIFLMAALAIEVTVGAIFRYVGYALVWFDEVATILLAWVTYYGAALAALKRAHLGVPELVEMLSPKARICVAILTEGCIFAFFIVVAWTGYMVLEVLATDNLVSIPEISVAFTQSVIPMGAVLFLVAEALVLPDVLRQACATEGTHDPKDGFT